MKKFLTMVLLFSSLGAWAGTIEVRVNGMVCSMCAQGIQKKFKSRPEVSKLNVDLDNKIVVIDTKDGESLNDDLITKLITEAGYNVASIERK
jgi:copper chaperone CopZ